MVPRPQRWTTGVAAGVAVAALTAGLVAAEELRQDGAPEHAASQPSPTSPTSGAPAAGAFVQAEALTLDPAKGQAFDDPQASGGQGLLLWADGAVTTPITGPVDHPQLRVRGDQCAGAPSMRVRLNGEKVAAQAVASEDWTTVTLDARSTAAKNVISVAYFGDDGQPGCDRNLRLDWIAASAEAAVQADAGVEPTEPSDNAISTPAPAPTPPAERRAQAGSDSGSGAGPRTAAGASGLYVDPRSVAAENAQRLRAARSPDAAPVERIAREPAAQWITGWDDGTARAVSATMRGAARTHTRAVFTLYAIPDRDCGSYSAGGVDAARYRELVTALAGEIGDGPAIVIVEPDALAQAECLSAAARDERFALLRFATARLAAGSGTRVYLDGGHSGWKSAAEMAALLRRSGIAGARGFALNTSNYRRTEDEVAYGRELSAAVGGKAFVIDTSRNGNGPAGDQWCNPSGRALGHAPTLRTGLTGVDAFLWIKRPGESDGNCNGGPAAGQWWQQGAVALARAAG